MNMNITISQRGDRIWIAVHPYTGDVLATALTEQALRTKLRRLGYPV